MLVCVVTNDSILMHDPIGFLTLRRFPAVKDKRFFHSNVMSTLTSGDRFVGASGLPITRYGCSIWACPIWILPLSRTEKIPFSISKGCLI